MTRPFRSIRNGARVNLLSSLERVEQRQARLEDELGAARVDGIAAQDVDFNNATSGLAATNVQAAIDELDGVLDALLDSAPAFTTTNLSTSRSLNADDASGAISASPTQGEVENIRDAVLALADVVGTLIEDLKTKDVLG